MVNLCFLYTYQVSKLLLQEQGIVIVSQPSLILMYQKLEFDCELLINDLSHEDIICISVVIEYLLLEYLLLW